MNCKLITITKAMLFFVVLLFIVIGITIMAKPTQQKKQIATYNSHEENSVDIAFIGSSTTYRYYDVMAIWDEYGITSSTYTSISMPFTFSTSMIETVQKNQSPEIYVFELRDVMEDEFNMKYLSSVKNKTLQLYYTYALNLIENPFKRMSEVYSTNYYSNENYIYSLEFFITHDNFEQEINNIVHGQKVFEPLNFMGNENMRYDLIDFDTEHEEIQAVPQSNYVLTEQTKNNLNALFEYCKENDIDAYFTFTPYVNARNSQDAQIRAAISDFVRENGFPMKDFMADFEKIGLRALTDFYDDMHVNALGAKKFSLYAMEYYLEEYKITPNYTQEITDFWQSEYEKWLIYDDEQTQQIMPLINYVNWKYYDE